MKYCVRWYQVAQPGCEKELFFIYQSLEIVCQAGLCAQSVKCQRGVGSDGVEG